MLVDDRWNIFFLQGSHYLKSVFSVSAMPGMNSAELMLINPHWLAQVSAVSWGCQYLCLLNCQLIKKKKTAYLSPGNQWHPLETTSVKCSTSLVGLMLVNYFKNKGYFDTRWYLSIDVLFNSIAIRNVKP